MQAAEPLDGTFVSALGRMARRYGLWLAAGMYEQTDGLPYNTVVVLDDTGMLRGCHRKNKLYDAFGYRESDECRAGSTPFSPISHAGRHTRSDHLFRASLSCTCRSPARCRRGTSLCPRRMGGRAK